MAFPAGVATFTLNFPPVVEMLSGITVAQQIAITPSTSVIWAATGTLLVGGPQVKTDSAGAGLSFILPDPTQAGFTDGAGNTVTNWTWDIVARYFYPQTGAEITHMRVEKTFSYIAGSGSSVNFTNLLTVSSTTGVTVSIPDQWSGLAAAETTRAIAAEGAETRRAIAAEAAETTRATAAEAKLKALSVALAVAL